MGIQAAPDPKFDNLDLPVNEKVALFGDSLIVATNRSRTLESKDEDYFLLSWTAQKDGKCKSDLENTIKKYGYKNKKSLFENMQYCFVKIECGNITISPSKHDKLEGWEGMDKKFDITIPSTSSPEVIGAAVKYSIARCTGKGADLVAKKLFPDGVPETFDDYLASLSLKS